MEAQTQTAGTAATVDQTPDPAQEPRFTQSDVDRIVSERMGREAKAREKAIADALAEDKKKRDIEALEGEARIKAEYEAKMEQARKEQEERDRELAETKRVLAITKAESRLVSLGLPAELAANVIGDDDKATERNIAALSKAVTDLVTKQVAAGLNHGAPRAGGGKVDNMSEIEAEFRREMGIPKE